MSPTIRLYGESASAYRGIICWFFLCVGIAAVWWFVNERVIAPLIISLGAFGLAYYHARKSYDHCGWKYIVIGFFLWLSIAGIIAGIAIYEDRNKLEVQDGIMPRTINTSTAEPPRLRGAYAIRTETPQKKCKTWDEISLDDVGVTTCVYGDAIDAYTYDETFFVIFSTTPRTFYFLSYGNPRYEGVKGNCVMASGKIEQLGQTPVMVVPDGGYYHCE